MKRAAAGILVGLALAAPALAQKAPPVPDLLQRALTPPPATAKQMFAYDFEDVTDATDPDGTNRTTVRGRIDPSRKKGDRVTITSLEETSKKPAGLKKTDETYEKSAEGDIFCDTTSGASLKNVVDKGVGPDGTHVFGFTPSAPPSAPGDMKDIYKKMTADVAIDEAAGVVRSFKARLTKKTTVMMIIDVKSAAIDMTCGVLPNGRPYATRSVMDFSGGAFGLTFSTKTTQTISNVTPIN